MVISKSRFRWDMILLLEFPRKRPENRLRLFTKLFLIFNRYYVFTVYQIIFTEDARGFRRSHQLGWYDYFRRKSVGFIKVIQFRTLQINHFHISVLFFSNLLICTVNLCHLIMMTLSHWTELIPKVPGCMFVNPH